MHRMADDTIVFTKPAADEVQPGWNDLKTRVAQLEAERIALQQDNKQLRFLLERVAEHRQKSHSELVNLLAGLVSKLPIQDVGGIVSRLIEHNTSVNQYLAALLKGTAEADLPKPAILKNLEQTKKELTAQVKPLVEELIKLETPIETSLLQGLVEKPESFFSPKMVQANRCFQKGQATRERIAREFGDEALPLFNDLTTDPKLNPRPKPDEIVLAFKSDFESLLTQSSLPAEKKKALQALNQRVQRCKSEQGRAQKNAFLKLSLVLELLYYYDHQNTEAPDVIFAQRLPTVIEQIVVTNPQDNLDEKLIAQAETLLSHIVNPDHRSAVVNNIGKGGGTARTLKYVLKLRAEKVPDVNEVVPELVRHLVPPPKAPPVQSLIPTLRLIRPEMQERVARGIMSFDKIPKDEAAALGKAVAAELGLKKLEELVKAAETISPEMERQRAWSRIKELIVQRSDPATVAAAIRERLNSKYDADELKESWLALIETDPMSFIRIFCQMPYRADGNTDPIAQTVLETYVTRLTHPKYAAVHQKVMNSLKNVFKANPNTPVLLNFVSLVKWVSPDAANKMSGDIGMPAAG